MMRERGRDRDETRSLRPSYPYLVVRSGQTKRILVQGPNSDLFILTGQVTPPPSSPVISLHS